MALAGIAGVAIAIRLVAGWLRGPDFVTSGYAFYADIATSVLNGNGFCYSAGEGCTIRMPLYPALVAIFMKAGGLYPGLVVFQSVLGGLSPVLTYAIARRLFTPGVGMIAAVASAFNPYSVIHDSAFQDTVVVNILIRAIVAVLLYSTVTGRRGPVAAGLLLAAAMLTTARVALLVPFIAAWLLWASVPGRRLIRVASFAVPILVLVGAWVSRNAALVGEPVLTTESGLSLWLANNPATMEVYPGRSVDELEPQAFSRLETPDRRRIESATDPLSEDRAYARAALNYVTSHPVAAVRNSLLKGALAFSGWLTPMRAPIAQLGYAMVFVPVNILALIGLWRFRRAGPRHALMAAVFGAYFVTAALFWAHTSHNSYAHPFKFAYAAAVIAGRHSRPIST